jgi:hypothetical protein
MRHLGESVVRKPLGSRESEVLRPNDSFIRATTTGDLGLYPELPRRSGYNHHTAVLGKKRVGRLREWFYAV